MRGQNIDFKFRNQRDKSLTLAKTKATDLQWQMIDWAISAFIKKYPTQWLAFQRELKTQRTKYQLATNEHQEMKKASWRNVAAFPTIEDSQGNTVDSLLPVLKKIIPELTHKNSVNFANFIKKYPCFLPGEKY